MLAVPTALHLHLHATLTLPIAGEGASDVMPCHVVQVMSASARELREGRRRSGEGQAARR